MDKGARKPRVRLNTAGVIDTLCERIAAGRSIDAVCRDPDMPTALAVYRLMANNPAFHDRITQARAAQLRGLRQTRLDLSDAAIANNLRMLELQNEARRSRDDKRGKSSVRDEAEQNRRTFTPEEAQLEYDRMIRDD